MASISPEITLDSVQSEPLEATVRGLLRSQIVCLVVLAACGAEAPSSPVPKSDVTLPITRRGFRTGTTPTTDRSRNPARGYELTKELGTLTMFWVTPNGIGLYDQLTRVNPVAKKTNYEVIRGLGLTPIINLNPWTVQPGRGLVRNDGSGSRDFAEAQFMDRMKAEAGRVAKRFQPEYICIGNEVNSVYEALGQEPFDQLAALEKALYQAVKAASPGSKVIVVLSYSQLVDLRGPPRFFLIPKLEGSYDALGLTSYPWKDHASPAKLPPDYYSRLARHTTKPIGFTEIAWSSDRAQGGSEEAQVQYLLRFLELTKGMNLAFVNWAFLHDLPASSVNGLVVQKTHLGLGLRTYEGTPKQVWHFFRALAALPTAKEPNESGPSGQAPTK